MKRISLPLFGLVILALVFATWALDGVTLKGERTIYTAECQGGSWEGNNCTGKLVAGDRFRFRALKAHKEVLFWTAGATNESSWKFSNCDILSGRNWRCEANADFSRTITKEMVHGEPVPDLTGRARPFHQVSKIRWYLIDLGLPTGSSVSHNTTN